MHPLVSLPVWPALSVPRAQRLVKLSDWPDGVAGWPTQGAAGVQSGGTPFPLGDGGHWGSNGCNELSEVPSCHPGN
jgi:hypothetical protein